MKKREMLARQLSDDYEEDMEEQFTMKTFNVKLDFNLTMHVEALAKKMESPRSEAIRVLLELGIEAMYETIDQKTKDDLKAISLEVAKELCSQDGGRPMNEDERKRIWGGN